MESFTREVELVPVIAVLSFQDMSEFDTIEDDKIIDDLKDLIINELKTRNLLTFEKRLSPCSDTFDVRVSFFVACSSAL